VPDPDSSGHCPDVRIAPGVITVSAEQIAPNHAVVVGQDLGENGVTIEYHISIDPTLVLYQKWEILDREVIACVEGKNNDPAYVAECGETNCGCPKNWHAVIEDIWGCRDYLKVYPEELDELSPGASLKLDSRAWIQGELAAAYPGAHLLNPDWSFGSEAECEWANNTCNLEFTLTIPVTDPGWYDIKLEGMTTGTLASPGRSFEITAGEFGVYMIDSSIR